MCDDSPQLFTLKIEYLKQGAGYGCCIQIAGSGLLSKDSFVGCNLSFSMNALLDSVRT